MRASNGRSREPVTSAWENGPKGRQDGQYVALHPGRASAEPDCPSYNAAVASEPAGAYCGCLRGLPGRPGKEVSFSWIGLAGPVRPEESSDPSRLDLETDFVDRDRVAVDLLE
jgi:hypothetical protein